MTQQTATLIRLPVESVRNSRQSLRVVSDEEPMEELGGSVGQQGVLSPILVFSAADDTYEVIFGERRLAAARRAGLAEIPALLIESTTPLDRLLLALAENLHRKDLDPFEEAAAFLRLMKDYGLSLKEIAERTNKREQYVTRRIEILSLPDEVKSLIAEKRLSIPHGVLLVTNLTSGEEQVRYATRSVENRLTIEELREVIKREEEKSPPVRRPKHALNAEKLIARLQLFLRWLQGVPRKFTNTKLNEAERRSLAKNLEDIELQARFFRAVVLGLQPAKILPAAFQTPETGSPRNYGAEWPAADVNRIHASDRPSDDVLAKELGRTVSAIRDMRKRTKK